MVRVSKFQACLIPHNISCGQFPSGLDLYTPLHQRFPKRGFADSRIIKDIFQMVMPAWSLPPGIDVQINGLRDDEETQWARTWLAEEGYRGSGLG